MKTVLRIDSSIKQGRSISRQLTGEFVAGWRKAHPEDVIVERNLTSTPAPHLTEATFGAAATPAAQRTAAQVRAAAIADELLEELLKADVLVIGAPMYDLTISSALKSWIDHVARAGSTFRYTTDGPVGLLTGKKAYVFATRGGAYSARVAKFHEMYLRSVLGLIGIVDVTVVHAEGLAFGEQAANEAIARTRVEIDGLLAA